MTRAASGRLRTCGPGSHMKDGCHVGNFVELKKTVLGEGSKANHLAYLGDATIGAGREHRRRHHHLQLRRRAEAPHRHRGRRLHRQRLPAHRAGDELGLARTSPPDHRSPTMFRRGRWESRGDGSEIVDWVGARQKRRSAAEAEVSSQKPVASSRAEQRRHAMDDGHPSARTLRGRRRCGRRPTPGVLAIYRYTGTVPATRSCIGLTVQLRRAAVSVPANFAEGFKRQSRPEKAAFLQHRARFA